ncbi:Protoporphyrin IX Mg-chelatase subunit H [Caenispirillum salinarum AK4]|uniref:magnesium chelatase n=1 Tax=Caenispirillum salinarum AK4 TaxID=1238182 RepID=K9H5K4_9PROT|nr:magnesium chelatase subunit H [Caenispirillum salinarum]EKV32857.1 Protoporphyrin IX Mg-chelatase subunit H [Caenispirillum salinarum AK4]
MTPRLISDADRAPAGVVPVRVVIVTLDAHLAGALDRARADLARDLPGLTLTLHSAVEWEHDAGALERCKADIAEADVILATMLFMEDHVKAILPALQARRDACDALVGCMSAGEIIRCTKLGPFRMDGADRGPLALLKRLRGDRNKKSGGGASGANQMAMLKRIPRILRLIPGKAQDLRAYFLTLQYWLAGSEENIANLVRFLVDRYAAGPRRALHGRLKPREPVEYPEVGLYHPDLTVRATTALDTLPRPASCKGTVGLLLMRSYVLAGNTAHYDGVIRALEAQGLAVRPAFASGLDARPAVDAFFRRADGSTAVDAVVSLTGFSLVGGPAYNDAKAAEETLAGLDVPILTAHALEFQTLEQWRESPRGLMPVEATMMVAIPELDGAISPMLYGGRTETPGGAPAMAPEPERCAMLAARVAKRVSLKKKVKAARKVAVVLFNFPPNAGATGTAAYLSVFQSLYNTLSALKADGYTVDIPADVDALRAAVLKGNAERHGQPANVAAHITADDHVRREARLAEIEAQWGPAPGRHQSDGGGIFVLGQTFGNVFVGIQPAFGHEGDPMRLMFEGGSAPTHAFSAFYRWLREDFAADSLLHFGMHGALEFMPGKQAGLSGSCWPDHLIGALPHVYLYAANNPSEATLAKRRTAATMVTHLTPPLAEAGLHRELLEIRDGIERWRALPHDATEDRTRLAQTLQAQAAAVEIGPDADAWTRDPHKAVAALAHAVLALEQTLIPHGLHVIGSPPAAEARVDMLSAMAEAAHGTRPDRAAVAAIVHGAPSTLPREQAEALAEWDRRLRVDHELPALLRALDGRYVRPAPGGDILRTPDVLPTGRNLHGFDPYRIPDAWAVADGARQADRILARHTAEGHGLPESIALVLWGTDNLKSGGAPLAQALALIGARPRFDAYGRLTGAALIPLPELGRPRIDVVMTCSGIFRDLLPLQTRLLAEAAWLAATAEDEAPEDNFVRKHALAYAEAHGCDMETAALRVFSNADGAYGSNVNHLIDSGCWAEEDELAETFSRRKCFAYGRKGAAVKQPELLCDMLAGVSLAYQNLESAELGITTIDHYFDTLGGISRAARRAKGSAEELPVYIGDQTRGTNAAVRTLAEQVALETHTRMLNPKWYEGLLSHGHEGVRQIEAAVTNTMGWSATTGQVAPWVYQRLTQTFLLDETMRERMAALNPTASARVANRLLEAHERRYWTPDPETLRALQDAGEDLEDRLEGVAPPPGMAAE